MGRRGARPRPPGGSATLRLDVQRRLQAAASRHRSVGDPGLDRLVRPAPRPGGRRARQVRGLQAAQAGPAAGRGPPAPHPDPVHQHDQPRAGARVPGRRGDRAPDPSPGPLERGRHGAARQQRLPGDRRSPLHLRQLREPLRGGLQPLLPGQGRRCRRPGLLPGSRRAGDVRAGLPRRASQRGPARQLPPRGGARARPQLVPPPSTHARLLGVPHGQHGPRAHLGHLPGPLQPLPGSPGDPGHLGVARLGLPGRRRDGRAGVPQRPRHGRARAARQPHLRRQLQPAASRRPGARERQGHPGAGGDLPGRRVERDQGDLGSRVGRAPGPRHRRRPRHEDERDRRRRVPEVLGCRRRLHPGALLRAGSTAGRARGAPLRRRPDASPPGRPRLPQALRRLSGRDRVPRRPHRHPGQDDQGLDPGPRRRGPQRHPPGEEALRGRDAGLPGPPRAADPRMRRSRTPRTSTRARTRRRSSTSSSGGARSAAPSRSGSCGRTPCPRPRRRPTPSSPPARPPPSAPRWSSPSCSGT